jgi:hypothetical protein
MYYMKVEWKHSDPDDPVWLYSELDAERYEIRKVDVFRDGRLLYADPSASHEATRLSEAPIPSLAEIASNPQFEPVEITKDEFEDVWRAAILDRVKRAKSDGAPKTDLEIEAAKIAGFLVGKYVRRVWRHRSSELVIEFDDGTALYVDWQPDRKLDFSITGGRLGGDDAG